MDLLPEDLLFEICILLRREARLLYLTNHELQEKYCKYRRYYNEGRFRNRILDDNKVSVQQLDLINIVNAFVCKYYLHTNILTVERWSTFDKLNINKLNVEYTICSDDMLYQGILKDADGKPILCVYKYNDKHYHLIIRDLDKYDKTVLLQSLPINNNILVSKSILKYTFEESYIDKPNGSWKRTICRTIKILIILFILILIYLSLIRAFL